MAFKLKSGNKPSFKNMGSSPVKQITAGTIPPRQPSPPTITNAMGSSVGSVASAFPQKSPAKQVDPDAKKVISSGKVEGKEATRYTKGARSKDGTTYEKGKTTTYVKQDDDTYTKTVKKVGKGATSDAEWKTKKDKTISAKKAERQIARKTKRAERSGKRADVKEVRGRAKTMRKDEGLTRADKKDIKTRKKATIKAIRNR
jgi:hypothetical protein